MLQNEVMISSEFHSNMVSEALTGLFFALFSQSSLELLIMGKEDCIELAHFLQLIFEELSLGKPFHCNSQELILGFMMFNQFLHKKENQNQAKRVQ
jgi:hypothetical protein